MKKLLLLLLIITSLENFSQATLVSDINKGNNSSNPSNKVEFNGFAYFIANDGRNGSELWRTDGTEIGTTIFKEFIAGEESGMVALTPFVSNNLMYFFAADGTDYFLWKTDGTLVGTEKVKQFVSIQGFHDTINNELVFTAENGLWKTDGTESGTIKLANYSIFGTTRFVKSGNEIYFSGETTSSIGQELYKTDGTTVSLVKNINPNSNKDSYPNNFATLNGTVYFSADNGLNGFELWKSDGTEAGTQMVKDINVGAGNSFTTGSLITIFNNKMFFIYDSKLWESDGTEAGTLEVKDLESYIKGIFVFNSKMHIFNAGNSFWTSDGTTAGTTKIEVNVQEFFHNSEYAIVGNKLFFQGSDRNGYEIWKTDGTAVGTNLVKDIHPEFDDNNIEDIIGFNGKAIFTASDGNWLGKELWISDGTESGTTVLKDINKEGNRGSNPQNHFQFGDKILFSADNGENGRELWKIDAGVTSLLKDINPGPKYSNPSNFILFNNEVYFSASTKEKGKEIWKTDGTEAGTVMIKDINANEKDGLGNSNFIVLNNKLFFFANDGTSGIELWETDGTESGTKLVKDINGISENSISNSELIVFKDELFFVANDGANGSELFKSDGTEAGTVLVKDINLNGSGNVRYLNVHPYLNKLYFSAYNGSETNLWESDGTGNNTFKQAVKNPSQFKLSGTRDIGNRSGSNIIYNTELYFSGESTSNFNKKGTELWAVTYSGTIQVVFDINPDLGSSYPSSLTDVKGKLYFTANDGKNGIELWKANGVSDAELVKNIESGNSNSNIISIGNIGDVVIFGAGNNSQNRELWKSEGTSEGTVLLQDINPSTAQFGNGSNPNSFFAYNNILYFSANDGTVGSELFMLQESALSLKDEAIKEFAKVSIFPNPTSNILKLKIDNQQIRAIKIYSLFGKEEMRFSNEAGIKNINISTLKSGIYLVKLKTDIGVFTKKIIKK
jgi:ELWxxDGT repeat protein